jgi:hypothetical protein
MGWTLKTLVSVLFCIIPGTKYLNNGPIRVDLIEVNHVHRPSDGAYVFSQVVYWKQYWTPKGRKFKAVDWAMLDHNSLPTAWPLKSHEGWVSLTTRHIGKLNQTALVKVVSPHFRESWTMYDVETADRQAWNYETREDLFDIPSYPENEENP